MVACLLGTLIIWYIIYNRYHCHPSLRLYAVHCQLEETFLDPSWLPYRVKPTMLHFHLICFPEYPAAWL